MCIRDSSYADIEGSVLLKKNVFFSGDFNQIIEGLKLGKYDPGHFKFFMGYSGWAANQLDSEISEKSWIIGIFQQKLFSIIR